MDIITITKLYKIFQNKRWTDNEGNNIVFENFCQLLLNLSEPQRELVIELAERYTWITLNEYQGKLVKVLESIEDVKLKGLKRVVLFPVMKPEDEVRTKSSHTILYMLRAIKPLLTKYKSVEFIEIESYENLKQGHFNLEEGECLYLLDDYLGSGETIKTTVEKVLKNRDIDTNQIKVLSIAAQQDSIDFLKKVGISYYSDLVFSKGISDYYLTPEKEQKIEIMKEIEKLIPGNHFSFGYNQSEALITLMRTPDNTFPIFWKEHKKDKLVFEAPFSRY